MAAPQSNAFFTGLRVLLVIHSQWCDPLTCEVTTEVTYEDFQHKSHFEHEFCSLRSAVVEFQGWCWHCRTTIAAWREEAFCGCVPTRTKNTWWIRKIRSRHFCHSSCSLIKEKCWVCVFQASLCAECWGLCWNLTPNGNVWTSEWYQDL